jgi:RND family efflux transporter MFP subunit
MTRIIRSIVLAFAFGATALSQAATFEGFTEPNRKIDVAAAETGTVAKLLVREGDHVTRGQPLALLDNDVLEVSREIAATAVQAKGKLESAGAERDVRRTRLERLEVLRAQGHASQEEVDRARGDLSVAEANLLAVREQRQLDELERKKIEAMIERRTLRSPIDGIVAKTLKDEREFVSSNAAAVLTVVQLDPLRVTFSLPTAAAAPLSVGRMMPLELPESGLKTTGKIDFIAPLTEAESGTVRVKVLVNNARGQYRCGVRCLLRLDETPGKGPAKPLAAGTAQR